MHKDIAEVIVYYCPVPRTALLLDNQWLFVVVTGSGTEAMPFVARGCLRAKAMTHCQQVHGFLHSFLGPLFPHPHFSFPFNFSCVIPLLLVFMFKNEKCIKKYLSQWLWDKLKIYYDKRLKDKRKEGRRREATSLQSWNFYLWTSWNLFCICK